MERLWQILAFVFVAPFASILLWGLAERVYDSHVKSSLERQESRNNVECNYGIRKLELNVRYLLERHGQGFER